VRLALDAGRPVSADRLLDDLWAGAPTQRNTLQSKVARLRRALQDRAVIDGAYRLDVRPEQVDALRALSDAAAATRRLDAGDEHGARSSARPRSTASAPSCCRPPAIGQPRTARSSRRPGPGCWRPSSRRGCASASR
jgi:hypothetical protein